MQKKSKKGLVFPAEAYNLYRQKNNHENPSFRRFRPDRETDHRGCAETRTPDIRHRT